MISVNQYKKNPMMKERELPFYAGTSVLINRSVTTESPVLLDVTIRDGGYLNEWSFTQPQMDRVVKTAIGLGLDFVEIGYIDDRSGLPAAASMRPESLEKWQCHREEIGLAVMCKPTVQDAEGVISARKGLVDLIRIPVDLRRTDLAHRLASLCEKHRIPYALNLTNISAYDTASIKAAYGALPDSAGVVYIADSRGNLTPDRIPAIYEALRSVQDTVFGFHAHDNLGLAVRNSEAALQCGATWLDGSILGIGLGGRNLDILDAASLADQGSPDLPERKYDQGVSESDFGVPPRGAEMALFRITGENNFKMEWAVMMARVLGQDEACSIISRLPSQPMFQPEELRPFLKEETWGRLIW